MISLSSGCSRKAGEGVQPPPPCRRRRRRDDRRHSLPRPQFFSAFIATPPSSSRRRRLRPPSPPPDRRTAIPSISSKPPARSAAFPPPSSSVRCQTPPRTSQIISPKLPSLSNSFIPSELLQTSHLPSRQLHTNATPPLPPSSSSPALPANSELPLSRFPLPQFHRPPMSLIPRIPPPLLNFPTPAGFPRRTPRRTPLLSLPDFRPTLSLPNSTSRPADFPPYHPSNFPVNPGNFPPSISRPPSPAPTELNPPLSRSSTPRPAEFNLSRSQSAAEYCRSQIQPQPHARLNLSPTRPKLPPCTIGFILASRLKSHSAESTSPTSTQNHPDFHSLPSRFRPLPGRIGPVRSPACSINSPPPSVTPSSSIPGNSIACDLQLPGTHRTRNSTPPLRAIEFPSVALTTTRAPVQSNSPPLSLSP